MGANRMNVASSVSLYSPHPFYPFCLAAFPSQPFEQARTAFSMTISFDSLGLPSSASATAQYRSAGTGGIACAKQQPARVPLAEARIAIYPGHFDSLTPVSLTHSGFAFGKLHLTLSPRSSIHDHVFRQPLIYPCDFFTCIITKKARPAFTGRAFVSFWLSSRLSSAAACGASGRVLRYRSA
jgi:hypothetical protein